MTNQLLNKEVPRLYPLYETCTRKIVHYGASRYIRRQPWLFGLCEALALEQKPASVVDYLDVQRPLWAATLDSLSEAILVVRVERFREPICG